MSYRGAASAAGGRGGAAAYRRGGRGSGGSSQISGPPQRNGRGNNGGAGRNAGYGVPEVDAGEEQEFDEYGNPIYYEDDEAGGPGGVGPDGAPPGMQLHPAVQFDEQGQLFVPPEIFLEELPELASTGGMVHKKGGKGGSSVFGFRSWKQLFMRLEGLDLVFYERAPPPLEAEGGAYGGSEAKPREVAVFNIDADTYAEPGEDKAHRNKNVKFDFTVSSKAETVAVYCESEEDMLDWIDIINHVAERIVEADEIMQNPYVPADDEEGADGGEGHEGYEGEEEGHGEGDSGDFYAPPEALAERAAPPYTAKGAAQGAKAAAARAAAAMTSLASSLSERPAPASVVTAAGSAALSAADEEERQIIADEAQCNTAHGPGLYEAVRGEATHFSITANDVTGVEKTYGGDPFTAAIVSDALHMDLAVADNNDGSYTVHYTPTRAGEFELRVQYAGQHIYGSPFHLTVARAPTAPNHCVVGGEGLAVARTGAVNTFTLTARDQFDDARGVGGDNFIITVAGGGKAHPILDLGDGTYTVSYEVDTAHRAYQAALAQAGAVAAGGPVPALALEVHISLMNEGFAYPRPISGSPFRPRVVVPEIQAALHQASVALHTGMQGLHLSSHHYHAAAPSSSSAAAFHHGGSPTVARALPFSPSSSLLGASAMYGGVAASAGAPAPVPTSPPHAHAHVYGGHHAGSPQHLSHHGLASSPHAYALAAGPASPSAAAEAAAAARVRAELEAKERAVSAGMHALEEMRRRVEEDRSAVDRQMLRMHELGQKVREDSERLADQARTLRALAVSANAGSPTQRSGAPSPVRGPGGGVYTVVPGGPVQAVDDAFAPEGFGATGGYGVDAGVGGSGGYYGAAGSPARRYGGGGVALSSPPAAAGGIGGTAELLFEPEVMGLFDRYRKPLAGLWQLYTSLSAPSGGGLPEGVDARRFLELFADYDIAPTFITRRELRQIFVAAARAHGTLGAADARGSPGGPDGLDASRVGGDVAGVLTYAGFVEALGRAALASLSKPAFAHLYPTARDKVLVLLEMWGLADVRKLSDMQHRPRKAAAAGGAYGEEAPGSPGHVHAYGGSGAGAMPVF